MLPIKLKLQGFFSYKDLQTIDFQKLTSNRIFGIFGNTGSGKSAIIEAIIFILYRKLSREITTEETFNLSSEQQYIEFEFLTPSKKHFKYIYSAKKHKNKKQEVEIKKEQSLVLEYQEGEWRSLDIKDKDIAAFTMQCLNTSYESFIKTVIIPQGKFVDFIEQEGLRGKKSERMETLKDIFKELADYEFSPITKELKKQKEKELNELQGALSVLEEVQEETIQQKEQEQTQLNEQLNTTQQQLEHQQQTLRVLKQQWSIQQQVQTLKQELQTLNQQRETIEQQKINLKTYKVLETILNTCYNPLQWIKQQVAEKQNHLQQLNLQKEHVQQQLEQSQKEEQALREQHPNIESLPEELQALQKTIDYDQVKQHIKHLKQQLLQLKEEEHQLKNNLEQSKQQENTLTLQRKKQSQYLQELNQWADLKNWWHIQLNYTTQLESLKQKINENNTQHLKREINTLKELKQIQHLAQTKLEQIETQTKHYYQELKLVDLVATLKDNHPCPLCGALDHPKILATNQQIETNIQENQQRLANAQYYIKKLEEQERYIIEQEQYLKEQEQHTHTFNFEGITNTPKEIEKVLKELEQIPALQKALKQLTEQEEAIQQQTSNLEKSYTDCIQKQQQQNSELQKALEQQPYSYNEAWEQESLQQLQQRLQKAQGINTSFKQLHPMILKQQQELATNTALIERTTQELNQRLSEQTLQHQKLTQELNLNNKTLQQLEDYKTQHINSEQVQHSIQTFETTYQNITTSLNLLEPQVINTITEEELNAIELKTQQATANFNQLNQSKGALENELVKLRLNWMQKQTLYKEVQKAQEQLQQIQTLNNLFEANGFTSYVAQYYFEEIVNNASERFHEMTNNYYIRIGENLTLKVVDGLNGGLLRSIKTLSGGQKFQLALCLALAMADRVKQHYHFDNAFFFIDEGFGALDPENLQIVFSSLQYLSKKNHTIGIISHLNDLKDNLQNYLSVQQTSSGSKIIPYY